MNISQKIYFLSTNLSQAWGEAKSGDKGGQDDHFHQDGCSIACPVYVQRMRIRFSWFLALPVHEDAVEEPARAVEDATDLGLQKCVLNTLKTFEW